MPTPSFEAMGKLAQVVLDGTVQTIYTVPDGESVIITRGIVADASGSGDSITVWTDGSADGNLIQPSTAIDLYGQQKDCCPMPLAAGATIKAQSAHANRLTFTLFGVRYNLT